MNKKKRIGRLFAAPLIMSFIMILSGCSGGGQGTGTQDPGSASSSPGSDTVDPDNTDQNGGNTDGNGTDSGTPGTDGRCEITAFATGKADSLLISSGDVNVLIDAGEEDDAELICKRLGEKGVTRLDLMIVTHFDRDHAGGVPKILEQVTADKVYYPDYANTKDVYLAFRRAVSDSSGEGKITRVTEFTDGDIKFVIYPEEDPESLRSKSNDFDNDMSLICMLYYKDYRFFFAGDIEKERIAELTDLDLKCDWIKMPHHGRYNKKLKQLLDACAPSYAVVTDSDEEIAETDTLVELQKRKIQTFSIRKGEIVTVADDEGISVQYAQ
ncbi:MAG: MBL fold metallo-hydrolase [Lachnospiraceae bacterium]|nr:MBL fold metallo-hydrolase [Lachnospiraceae bacterium]